MRVLYTATLTVEPASWDEGRVPVYSDEHKCWLKLGAKPIQERTVHVNVVGVVPRKSRGVFIGERRGK